MILFRSRKVKDTFKDGKWGKKVILYEEDYKFIKNGKNHSVAHPEIETHLHIVKKAIENPTEVRQDKNNINRKCFYFWFNGDNIYNNIYMKVVLVEHKYRARMYVINAYFENKVSSKEKKL